MLNFRSRVPIFLLLVLFFPTIIFSQQNRKLTYKNPKARVMKAGDFIDVNATSYVESSYTPEKLVKDILINGGTTCATANVTNVTISPNHEVTNDNRFWGYFNKGTTNFPFEEGIVLTTGFARQAGNITKNTDPNFTSNLGARIAFGQSDSDLVAATNPSRPLHDAVTLEFDFIPGSNQVKFNYLFASEEYYNTYPCQYSDVFALLIRPVSGGPYVNLAILPNNAGPVRVTNIHTDTQFNGVSPLVCGAVNAQYFDAYNPEPLVTNYNGKTIPLTAIADVTPGVPYHFKMVLADAGDQGFDSAVFLEGGSFDIGIKIVDGNGIALPDTLNICDNVPQILTAQVATVPGMTLQWFKDGSIINGANSVSYTANQPGVYEVRVSIPGNQCSGSALIKINGGITPNAQNATLQLCATPAVNTFNLNDAIPLITTTSNAVLRFYANQADADAQNNNYINDVTNFNGADGQVLYVVVSNGGFCSRKATLTLSREETPVVQLAATQMSICKGGSVTLTASGGVTYVWNDTAATGATRTLSPNETTTYTVYAIGAKGCKSLQPARITIEVVPAIVSDLSGGMICTGDQITLDAGQGPNYTYLWNTGDTSQTITVATSGTYSVTIDNGVCTKVFTTQVLQAIIPTITKVDYNENGTMIFTASNPSNGPLEYSVDNGTTWQDSPIFSSIPKNKLISIRVRVKKTSCEGFLEYFTFVMQNVITPNGDNINDKIDFSGLIGLKDFKASVFDRYGREVYKAEKVRPFWDGYFQGKRLLTSSYWYQITFEDPASKQLTVKTGWILLKNVE
ncbi:choice-of-anchor L domain-containing protein [Chryseobacterium fistulae]|uniref:Ig-like domain-containing protein n=1 Tax=Chryseobacterium fistulae TaxID=2675058 RepID=A0A6N4XQF7_9FLAO|nr:choice-of-anchor L domain-containing protein [Chryseobacterium fistulae]CAA7387518.1 hypothetical protein CHRY9393_01702 [Chryseobacterium fistulae]